MDLISALGLIAPIGQAMWEVFEARKSRNWTKKAARIYAELIQRRGLAEVSRIHLETKRVTRIAREIGPGATEEQLAGKHCGEIIMEVERYIDLLLEYCDCFQGMEKLSRLNVRQI